ncbi:MAG TPA: septum formation initiator family protein [Alphaproteobacteria bacterium]|jgi:cell division protein FtsB|nr:septum formation initiator family protein [Alphaproteobacteria bacterium]
MALMGEIRRRARHVAGPMLMVSVAVYFGYHAVQGDRGLIAWWQVTQRLKNANATYARVHDAREALEHRVALLGPDQLDLDLLDERAHIVLGLARPDEVEILDLPPAAPSALPSPQTPPAAAPETRPGPR